MINLSQKYEPEMFGEKQPRTLIHELWRQRFLLFIMLLGSSVLGLFVLWIEPPRYESSSLLYVHGSQPSERLMEGEFAPPSAEVTLVQHTLTSRAVVDKVIKDLGLSRALKADSTSALGKAKLRRRLSKMVEVRAIDRNTLQVTVRAADRWRAVAINNGVCQATVGVVKDRLRRNLTQVASVREKVVKEVSAELGRSRAHSIAMLDSLGRRSLTVDGRMRLEAQLADQLTRNTHHQQELQDLIRVQRASLAALRKEAIEPITVMVKAEPDVRPSLLFDALRTVLLVTCLVFFVLVGVLVFFIKRGKQLLEDWHLFNSLGPHVPFVTNERHTVDREMDELAYPADLGKKGVASRSTVG